jgi:magnesium chelatase family protein
MSLAVVHSRALAGIHAPAVNVEVHLSKGLPGFSMVGLPEKAVKESKDRVRSAIINCGFKFPSKRIVVNLSPADLPKEGGRFDLPIAIGILLASEQLPPQNMADFEIAGELALSGELRGFAGALPLALATQKQQRTLIIPKDNAAEVALLSQLKSYSAEHLLQVCQHFLGEQPLPLLAKNTVVKNLAVYPDLSDVKGQIFARRALEIAAAGSHSLLLTGPPGAGKTLLASRLPGILPPMQEQDALEMANIYSISQQGFHRSAWGVRPFRSPHHTASSCALVGGGSPPRPGEISLAHQGVLFLDELPEFQRAAIEALREPLEAGKITISRAAYQAEFPARFQLIAAMNPCPCGYATVLEDRCTCSAERIQRYQSRISGPMMDRIDMHVKVLPLANEFLLQEQVSSESSAVVRQRVVKARAQQQGRRAQPNAWLSSSEILVDCQWTAEDRNYFTQAVDTLKLSARAYYRVLKLARTIADLDVSSAVQRRHLEEALCFRPAS